MQFIPIKTRQMNPPKDNIFEVFDSFLPQLMEKDVLLVTSKVVSIHQGRCIKREAADKKNLAIEEAEQYLQDDQKPDRIITITNHALSANSGIDGLLQYYALLPKNPMGAAKEIQQYLLKKHSLSHLGVIITDSHSVPLRRGVICYAVGYYGISPLIEHGEKHGYTKSTSNAVDPLAAIGGLYMGESAQLHKRTPFVIIRETDHITFSTDTYEEEFFVEGDNDIYNILYNRFTKKK